MEIPKGFGLVCWFVAYFVCVCLSLVCFVFKNSIRVLYMSLLSQLPHWVVHRVCLVPFAFYLFWFFEKILRKSPCKTEIILNHLKAALIKTLGRWKKFKEVSCLFNFFLWSIFCGLCAWRCMCLGSQCEKPSAHSSVQENFYEQPGSPREATTPSKGPCSRKQHHCCIYYQIILLTICSGVFTWCNSMGSTSSCPFKYHNEEFTLTYLWF